MPPEGRLCYHPEPMCGCVRAERGKMRDAGIAPQSKHQTRVWVKRHEPFCKSMLFTSVDLTPFLLSLCFPTIKHSRLEMKAGHLTVFIPPL